MNTQKYFFAIAGVTLGVLATLSIAQFANAQVGTSTLDTSNNATTVSSSSMSTDNSSTTNTSITPPLAPLVSTSSSSTSTGNSSGNSTSSASDVLVPPPGVPAEASSSSASSSSVGAVSSTTTPFGGSPSLTPTTKPTVVSIDGVGAVLMRGVVESINGSTLTINSWGGLWTVTLSQNSTVAGASTVDGIHLGDYVGVIGEIATSNNWAVNASYIRDWTLTR